MTAQHEELVEKLLITMTDEDKLSSPALDEIYARAERKARLQSVGLVALTSLALLAGALLAQSIFDRESAVVVADGSEQPSESALSRAGDAGVQLEQLASDPTNPNLGDEVLATVRFHRDCANSVWTIAFDAEWVIEDVAEPIWRTFDTAEDGSGDFFDVEGVLTFESWDRAEFRANGEVLFLTHTGGQRLICLGW